MARLKPLGLTATAASPVGEVVPLRRRARPRARGGLKIHYEELDALREAEDNPNQHSKEQITLMERLLVEYGWITPMGNRRRAGLRPRQVGVSLAAMSPTSPTL